MWAMWLRLSAVLFLAISAGCASQRQVVRPELAAPAAAPAGGWVVRLEVPDSGVMVHVPPGESEVVELSDAEYEEAIRSAAREITIRPGAKLDPLGEAERLFEVGEQSGVFLYEVRTGRLTQIDTGGPMIDESAAAAEEMTRNYLKWCGRQDCLGLLKHSAVLTPHGRYVVAWELSKHSVLESTEKTLKGIANAREIGMMLTSAMAMYMLLWLVPEPVSKGIAAAITLYLIGYLGWDLFTLAEAWETLVKDADKATTFEQLRAAGHQFGERAGGTAARVAVLLVSYAMGRSLPTRGPKLPGFEVAEAQGMRLTGVSLAEAGAVRTFVGPMSVSLGGNLAMMGKGSKWRPRPSSVPPAKWTPPAGGPGKWIQKLEAMFPRARQYQRQVTGRPDGWTYRVKRGNDQADFDDYRDGLLLEAKGPGYADLLKKDPKRRWLQAFRGMVETADRQVKAAGGTRIEWHFAEKEVADLVRTLFREQNYAIKVVHTPAMGGIP